MRAVVVTDDASARLALGEVEAPEPSAGEALVRVEAFSLNRGEVNFAQNKDAGSRIGWDIAGVVERQAADGSGPAQGAQVAAFLPSADGWAEQIAVPTNLLAGLPQGIDLETAAALPVAGLTALRGLDKGQRLAGRRVAITGATGGVGGFAVQIAAAMGARVVAQVRREEQVEAIHALGAHEVVVGSQSSCFAPHAPYVLALDGLGGEMLGGLMTMLDRQGVAVSYGGTVSYETTYPVYGLTRTASVYGFSLYDELDEEEAGVSLGRLLELVLHGQVEVEIGHRALWGDVGEVAQALLERKFRGKAVLRVRD